MKSTQMILPGIFADERGWELERFVNVAESLGPLAPFLRVNPVCPPIPEALRSTQLSMGNYLRVVNRNWYVMAPVVKLPPTRITAPRVY